MTTSMIAETFASTYTLQVAKAQNQANSNASAIPLRNLTGSVQVLPRLSQVIQSKANVSLSEAATSAEKAAGVNSHVISAHLRIVNGFLVYVVHVVDTNNNIHRIIVDAGNEKILSNALTHPGIRSMFGHYYGHGIYGRDKGPFLSHHGPRDII